MHEDYYRAGSIATLLFSLLFGIAAGYLYPNHFENARIVFWISFAVAAVVWLITVLGGRRILFGYIGLLDGLKWCNIALFAISVIGLSLADSRAPLHAALFGADIALLGYLLINSVRNPSGKRINKGSIGQDTNE